MTAHEVFVALFWIVIAGYATYLGWTFYRITVERTARTRHPSSLSQLAGGDAEVRARRGSGGDDCEPSADSGSLVELLFD
jgi:hypothetical protein